MKVSSSITNAVILRHLLLLAAMVGVISAVFFSFYEAAIREGAPIHYAGDSLKTLSQIQAIEEGSAPLLWPKTVARLNAPDEAWWSDYPHGDWIFWMAGEVAKWQGAFIAGNLAVWASLILAGVSFYAMACTMGARPLWAALLGTLFALSPYGFVRHLEHLILTVYFVVPLIIWIAWRVHQIGENAGGFSKKEKIVLLGLSLLCGCFNPYYLVVLFLFLGFLALGSWYSRQWRQLGWIVAVGGMASVGFLLQNMDYFLHRAWHGTNPQAISRELWWMVQFGLYLPDMVLPKFHQSEWIRFIGGKDYHFRIPEVLAGESQTAYIGAVALAGLGGLLLVNFGKMFGGQGDQGGAARRLDPLFLFALVLFLFAVVGGLNYLAGAFGFQLFRASNRYSIFFMAIGLLAVGLFFSRFLPHKWWAGVLAAALLAFGLWDQIPYIPDWQRQERTQAAERFREDRLFFPQMEATLPEGSRVFQLPVHFFPEMGKVYQMDDYEHLRPYLHTKALRFSYGTAKGRQHMLWQRELDFASRPEQSLLALEERGFAAILVNRRAYPDGAESISEILRNHGWVLKSENGDFRLFLREREVDLLPTAKDEGSE